MDDTRPSSSDDSQWVVESGGPEFPADVIAAAAGSHVTLAEKLDALRSLPQPFLLTQGPAVGDRWIEGDGEHLPGETAEL